MFLLSHINVRSRVLNWGLENLVNFEYFLLHSKIKMNLIKDKKKLKTKFLTEKFASFFLF